MKQIFVGNMAAGDSADALREAKILEQVTLIILYAWLTVMHRLTLYQSMCTICKIIHQIRVCLFVCLSCRGSCHGVGAHASHVSQMRHPNVVSFFEAFRHDSFVCIVMEHCEVSLPASP